MLISHFLPVISYEVCDAYYVYITVELSGKSKVKAKKLFPDCAPPHLPHPRASPKKSLAPHLHLIYLYIQLHANLGWGAKIFARLARNKIFSARDYNMGEIDSLVLACMT